FTRQLERTQVFRLRRQKILAIPVSVVFVFDAKKFWFTLWNLFIVFDAKKFWRSQLALGQAQLALAFRL
ncbi:MAG: hypothetical protein KDD19_02955, partial [Phaeodactylibacter sp.]|nr:hypothetical protein [Phaeodactylibacter sp.]